MSTAMKLEITPDQQKLLLQGLRYVQNSVALKVEEPTPEYLAKRNSDMAVIRELSAIVSGQAVRETASV